jgi:hypothetical protein
VAGCGPAASALSREAGGLLAINLGCLVLNLFQIGSFWFIWVGPAVLLVYAAHARRAAAGPAPQLAPVTA